MIRKVCMNASVKLVVLDFQQDVTCSFQYFWLVRSIRFCFQKLKSATVLFHKRKWQQMNLCFWNVQFCIKYYKNAGDGNPDIGFRPLFICFQSNMSKSDISSIWTIYLNSKHRLLWSLLFVWLPEKHATHNASYSDSMLHDITNVIAPLILKPHRRQMAPLSAAVQYLLSFIILCCCVSKLLSFESLISDGTDA